MSISEQDYAEILARRSQRKAETPRNPTGQGRAEACHSVEPTPKKKKRDRYAENAGELGKKIFAHREQLKGSIRLWLPYPPSTNNRMSNVGGHMIKSAEARSYQKIVKEALTGITPLTGDLEVVLTINRPRRSGDIDNVLKNIFDSLTGIAFIDDEQIAMLDAKRYDGTYAKESPGVRVQITTMKGRWVK